MSELRFCDDVLLPDLDSQIDDRDNYAQRGYYLHSQNNGFAIHVSASSRMTNYSKKPTFTHDSLARFKLGLVKAD